MDQEKTRGRKNLEVMKTQYYTFIFFFQDQLNVQNIIVNNGIQWFSTLV